jgi:putative DNA primase/helicase
VSAAPVPSQPGIVRAGREIHAARSGTPLIPTRELDKAAEAAWRAIVSANDHTNATEFLFRYGDQPCRLERNDDGQLIPRTLTPARMRFRLTEIARYPRATPSGKQALLAAAPMDLVANVLATPDPPLPILSRIVEVPVLRRDGSLHDRRGYSAGVFYEPTPNLRIAKLPSSPSARAVRAARKLLAEELLGDFPFVSAAEQAHAICLVVQPFVRELVEGPTPLYLVEAPTPGTGKGKLVHAACWATNGAPIPAMTEGRDEDEWRKRITAALRGTPTAILIDNVRAPLDSAALSAVLTNDSWTDRKLGTSEMVTLPNRATWIATGNNPQLSGEIMRRSVRIRLDADAEHPEDRSDFRHPNLEGWARENRGRLVAAALTLALAWIAAGRPCGERSLGSFESWSAVMGGILAVAAIEGFLANLDSLRENAGSEQEAMLESLSLWRELHGGKPMKAAELDGRIVSAFGLDPWGDQASKRVGKLLQRHRDRRYGDLRLRQADKKRDKTALWYVEKVAE